MKKDTFLGISLILVVFLLINFVLGSVFNLKNLSFIKKIKENECFSQNKSLFVEPIKNFIRESQKMVFVGENSLIAISPPTSVNPQVLGDILGSVESINTSLASEGGGGIVEYIVEPGDTLSALAKKYNISLETILWANDLQKGTTVKPGQKIIIPPVSGVIHYVKKNDTLEEIAKTYKSNIEEIIAFNNLPEDGDIFIGDVLIIPNGKMPEKSKPIKDEQIPLASSYFIYPTLTGRITQGLHWYNAIDFGGKCGDPILSVAAGVVLKLRYGFNGGAGNYLSILHPNGVVTTYGHIQASLVKPGDNVSQGQTIAIMGGKPGMPGAGISTGCHVHFSVHGAKNPFAK